MAATTTGDLGNDVVSQSEIEQLLAQVGSVEAQTLNPADPDRRDPGEGFVQRYEFPQLSIFSAAELRRLRVRYEDFISSLGSRLSIQLGLEVKLQMAKLETASFENFAESLSNPTQLSVIKIEKLQGLCYLDMPLRLGLCVIDRELGGPGIWRDEPRELTKMEAKLLAKVTDSIIGEWCGVWKDLLELRPMQTTVENNSRFLQTTPAEEMMMILAIEVGLGVTTEQIHLAVPCSALEPLMTKLNAASVASPEATQIRRDKSPRWNAALENMAVHITAELPGLELTARQITNLKPGDHIALPPQLFSQVRVLLEGTPRFVGTLGTSDNRLAVKIAGAIKP